MGGWEGFYTESIEVLGPDGKPMSKKGLKKMQRDAEKAAKKAQRQQQLAEEAAATDADDFAKDRYGIPPMLQSKDKVDRTLSQVKDLSKKDAGQRVWLRGRLHTSRSVGKQCFFVLRQNSTHFRLFCSSTKPSANKWLNSRPISPRSQ